MTLYVVLFIRGHIVTRQGTAFGLEGVGIVSCEHVVPVKPKAYLARNPKIQHEIEVVAKSKDTDLAVLKCEGLALAKLEPSYVEPRRGDNVKIAGYPHFAPGASGTIATAMVTGWRDRFSRKILLVDIPIVVGTSGGPVFDVNGRVVGIAVCGIKSGEESNIQESGFIPLSYLKELVPGS